MTLASAIGALGDGRTVTLALSLALLCITIGIIVRASTRIGGAAELYAAGHALSGPRNGLALAGTAVSAAPFLGIAGTIAISGYDGFLDSVGFLVAWIPALLVAGPMRNAGRFTMADVLAARAARQPAVRIAASVSTVTVSVCYLVAQMVGAGVLAGLLLGARPGARFHGVSADAEVLTIVVVGVLVICCVAFGGMRGTTWVQIMAAALMVTGAVALTLLVLARSGSGPGRLLDAAARGGGAGRALLGPGMRYAERFAGHPPRTPADELDLAGLVLAVALGTAGLPHIFMRFSAVPSARAARASVNWAIGLAGAFALMALAFGAGATVLAGRQHILVRDPAGNAGMPLIARELGRHVAGPAGGDVALALVAAVAFAAILAVAAGLVMAASASLAHDYFGQVLMLGRPKERQEISVARFSAVLIGSVAVLLAVVARDLDVAFLVALAFTMAASANLPAIVCALFWRRFNAAGAVAGIYGGLLTSIVLVAFSPVVSGKVDPVTGRSLSLFPRGVDFHWFPLENPGLVSIPAGFLCAVAGSHLRRERADRGRFAELSVRALTGAGTPRPRR